MNILLLNTSTNKIEFGYFENTQVIFEKSLENEFNADILNYLLLDSFKNNGKKIKNVEAVSIVNGPGSFTGLRVGSAIAKGICAVTNSLLIEINALDLICNKYKDKLDRKMTVVPLIPANTKEMEFYYAEYLIENKKMNRISDYKIDIFDNIFSEESFFLINEKVKYNFSKNTEIINLENISNIKSQFELTELKISNKEISDYKTSEPFYIKKFTPLKK